MPLRHSLSLWERVGVRGSTSAINIESIDKQGKTICDIEI
jgi:hypothetical protein